MIGSGRLRLVFAAAVTVFACALLVRARPTQVVFASEPGQAGGTAKAAAAPAMGEQEARAMCGVACHGYPPPDILPKASWPYEFYRMGLVLHDQPEPAQPPQPLVIADELKGILEYYLAKAPVALPPPSPWPGVKATGFARRYLSPANAPPGPSIANVRLFDLDDDGKLEVVAADMRHGLVLRGKPYLAGATLTEIAQIPNPDHIELTDFDKDGIKDFLVADLGEFLPRDHTKGSVVWLRGTKSGQFQKLSIDGFPRVADVQAADFNADGKLDIAVAAFGWRKVGHIAVLENHTTDYSQPSFENRMVDKRPGGIHLVPVDINKDGALDMVGLLAQQYESIVAYINKKTPDVSFDPQVIYAAPHPNWGSSGIQVVDLDGDGDLDVLYTHGDTFDDSIVKPYHGIQWLENKGSYPFAEHKLADLPGAFRAQAADMDGDGDLDIVACAFIAAGSDVDESALPSLVWMEQTKPGVFERRTLQRGEPRYATLDTGDIDGDGDIDIVLGTFRTDNKQAPWVEVWENLSKSAAAK